MTRSISLDIGSTFTKGGLFVLDAGVLRLERRAASPTTVADLGRGVKRVLAELLDEPPDASESALYRRVPLRVCSSARGGLRIAAIGLTPALTLAAARQAACSAGGRVVRAYSFSLTDGDVRQLECEAPDVILLAGGTDGGHTARVLENARRLAASSLKAGIIYAGNRSAAASVREILAGKLVRTADNVMPEVGVVTAEPAREAIRRVYLDTIVEGTGLGRIRELSGFDPVPTPAALLELVRSLPDEAGLGDVLVVDMGGATTDVYSRTGPAGVEPDVVVRGLPEPSLKRTVEGDLGLRVSVRSLRESAAARIRVLLEVAGLDPPAFDDYVERVADRPEALPTSAAERSFDAVLARACLEEALSRHAGRRRSVATPSGRIRVQRGKDVRSVRTLIGTGGYLSRRGAELFLPWDPVVVDADEEVLLPGSYDYRIDEGYLWPLLGNLLELWPGETARLACEVLTRRDAVRHREE